MNYKRYLVPIAVGIAQLHPLHVLAASYHSEPNPVGEKAYAAHSLMLLLPVGVIVCAFLFVWLLAPIHAKTSKRGQFPTSNIPRSKGR
jgi:hypothetical protein